VGNNGATEAITVLNNGNVGIGTTGPTDKLSVVAGGSSIQSGMSIITYNNNTSLPSYLEFAKSHSNTVGSLVTTVDQESLGTFNAAGVNTINAIARGARIRFIQDGTAGVSWVPAMISFQTSDGTADAADRLTIKASGNVGIGTTSPASRLEVNSAVVGKALVTFNETGDQNILTASASGTTVFSLGRTGNATLTDSGTSNVTLNLTSTGDFDVQDNGASALFVSDTGLVGLGTNAPTARLHTANNGLTTTGKSLTILDQYESQDILTASASGTTKLVVDNTGTVFMGTNTTLGTSTAVCWEAATINGATLYKLGDCSGSPADLAELYPITNGKIKNQNEKLEDVPEAGDVVAIGEALPKYVTSDGVNHQTYYVEKSRAAYDRKTIGVVSTKSWQVMGEDILEWAEAAVPVALTGRVPVKIASTSEPISAGDLLAPSDEPGKAMKATTPGGTTIGKALESWSCSSPNCPNTVLAFLNLTDHVAEVKEQATPTFIERTLNVLGDAIFESPVNFLGRVVFRRPPVFPSDSAGLATIPTYGTRVDVVFDQSYETPPIITISLSLDAVPDATESAFLEEGVKAMVAGVTTNRFTIALPIMALRDYTYSWHAMAVQNPKHTVGTPLIPTEASTPTPTVTPEATSSGQAL